MIPVFIGVTIILFILRSPAVVPGDPIRMLVGERAVSEAVRQQVIRENALDKPMHVQYWRYLTNLVQGDLGDSYQLKRPVSDILFDKIPNTLKLALMALVIQAIIGIAAGILSALKQYSFWDILVTLCTSILVSLPVFWLGMLLQLVFGLKFKQWGLPYLPMSWKTATSEFPTFVYYILPALTLASVSTAYTARITRSQLLEVMGQEYIRTGRAKGLSGRSLVWKHGLKNAMIPVVTFLGLDLAGMVGGTILTETVFNYPGVGLQIFHAIELRDWPVVTGGVVMIVLMVMLINLIVDVSYAFLDPRIRYGKAAEG